MQLVNSAKSAAAFFPQKSAKMGKAPKKIPRNKISLFRPFLATMTAKSDGPGSNYQLFMQRSKARRQPGRISTPIFVSPPPFPEQLVKSRKKKFFSPLSFFDDSKWGHSKQSF